MGNIHKIIHVIGVVAIENINICFPIAIIAAPIKADFPGDHPFTRRGMSTSQPAGCSSTTVIIINRIIDNLCAGLTGDAVPASSLPVWCDTAMTFLITTKVITAKVVFCDLVVCCEGVQDPVLGTNLMNGWTLISS